MKAIELHLGSPIYSVTPEEIREYDVDSINLKDGKVKITCHGLYSYSIVELNNVDPEATQADSRTPITYYFNLDDAEMAQLLEREKAVKVAFDRMERCQKDYQELVAKYMFAEPSKPIMR